MNLGFLVFLAMAIAMWLSSALRGDLTPKQAKRKGFCQSFSGISHVALWADIILLPWLAGIIYTYHSQWSTKSVAIAFIVGLLISIQMHALWVKTQPSDHNLVAKRKLTTAGHIHLIFMAGYLCLTMLFYFFTDDIKHQHLQWITVLLGLHVTASTVGLNLVRQKCLDIGAVATTIAVWSLLLWRFFA